MKPIVERYEGGVCDGLEIRRVGYGTIPLTTYADHRVFREETEYQLCDVQRGADRDVAIYRPVKIDAGGINGSGMYEWFDRAEVQ